mmetsp:Transcript_23360/g.48873  ORF Transcript_23360/g.48873 Transcript_23360/m.48873 type:complete len:214 (+) Transcript_23360:292-933(+)
MSVARHHPRLRARTGRQDDGPDGTVRRPSRKGRYGRMRLHHPSQDGARDGEERSDDWFDGSDQGVASICFLVQVASHDRPGARCRGGWRGQEHSLGTDQGCPRSARAHARPQNPARRLRAIVPASHDIGTPRTGPRPSKPREEHARPPGQIEILPRRGGTEINLRRTAHHGQSAEDRLGTRGQGTQGGRSERRHGHGRCRADRGGGGEARGHR